LYRPIYWTNFDYYMNHLSNKARMSNYIY